jgi:molybdate transport system substrate-binding protein
MTKTSRLICLGLIAFVSACAPLGTRSQGVAPRKDLVVMAAASLSEAFTQLGTQFEAGHPETHVVLNLAGSQQLAQQLAQGAPADVFASANEKQMQVAIDAGRVAGGSARVFATNRLTVIGAPSVALPLKSADDLARPGLKVVLAAGNVPAGEYALEFLGKASASAAYGADYQAAVLKNVVSYEENVRSVVAKVALGEADAGIVYKTDVIGENSGKVASLDIPPELNVVASYPIAVIADSKQPETAQAFMDLALSPEGQAILAHLGFSAAQP